MLNALKNLFSSPVSIDYMLNDPLKPIVVKTDLPKHCETLKYAVNGSTGKNATQVSSLAWEANECTVTLETAIANIQKIHPIKSWAATSVLKVLPRAGVDLNAYYDRTGLKFFYIKDTKTGKWCYLVDSTDVVAHELHHAFLDAIRPDFWSIQAPEIPAYHEGQADCGAMTYLLLFPEAIDFVLAETKGNLRQSNTLSRLAEQAGLVCYDLTNGATLSYALRDAVNNFKYADPATLPEEAPDSELTSECHSFGRLWVGCWYDVLVGIYEKLLAKNPGMTQHNALARARDVAYSLMVNAVARVPKVSGFYHAMANMMMTVDLENGGNYQDVIKIAFGNRGINVSSTTLRMLSVIDKENIMGGDVKKFATGVLAPQKKMIKLGKSMVKMQTIDGVDLSNVEIEVAADKYFHVDKAGNIVEEISSTEEEQLTAAMASVRHIKEIGSHSMWDVKDNKLVRNHMVCGH